jgi:hypothetical protein
MNIFVDAARLIANMGSFGQNFVGVGDSKFSGEYLAASVTSMGADFATAGASLSRLISPASVPTKVPFTVDTLRQGGGAFKGKISVQGGKAYVEPTKSQMSGASIILWTITAVELLELLTGFGPPDEGDDLKAGSQQFTEVAGQLKSAIPDDQWQGPASQNYTALDTTLQDIAQTLAELDLQLAAIARDHAEWVTHMRLGFGILKGLLFAAYIIEVVMTPMPPPGGPLPSRTFAITVSVLGAALALGMLFTLLGLSVENAKRVDGVTAEYQKQGADAVQKGQKGQEGQEGQPQPDAAETTVSSIEDISANMPRMSAAPDVSKMLASDGDSADERPLLSALRSEGETAGDGAPEAPGTPETPDKTTPDKTTPATPTATTPTLAQLTQMSGQAAKLSGHVSQHANLVNQAMGQIQQLAQMAQQGQGAAAPAEAVEGAVPEEAALAGDVEGAGAALGTEAAERAPIEGVPVGPEAGTEAPWRVV